MNRFLTLIFLIFFNYFAHSQTNLGEKVKSIQVINFEKMPKETITDKIARQWIHGEKGQIAYFHLKKGAHIPMHKHPNEQITYIMKGKVKIISYDKNNQKKTYIIKAGQVIIFPGNVPHEFFALEETLDLDIHIPVRNDWLNKELPKYLKNSQ